MYLHNALRAALVVMFLTASLSTVVHAAPAVKTPPLKKMDPALAKEWLKLWEANILGDSKNRYCNKETGEEIGWLVSPFTEGFYYGYEATGDTKWVDMLIDWTDSWVKRGIKEPDGYIGWPKDDGASTQVVPGLYTDNILGEAMGLRPAVQMADTILKTPALKAKYGEKARGYIALSERTFEKWDKRGCWREVKVGGVWVVPTFGIDKATNKWTDGYAQRGKDGFTLPANKHNFLALWLLSMYDATKKPIYKERAEKWFLQMKSRMRSVDGGKRLEWNYWDPAGPWDYKPDGSTKHWVGVHPNGGYYLADTNGIVAAYEYGLVFTKQDIDKLIATNRDFMWNQEVKSAKFQSIGGGPPDDRWKDSPGTLWSALTPYDAKLRAVFEANHKPDSWGGLSTTPWYVSRMK